MNQLGFLLPGRADDLAPLALEQLAEFEDGWRQTILRFEMGERSLSGDVGLGKCHTKHYHIRFSVPELDGLTWFGSKKFESDGRRVRQRKS